MAEEQQEKPPDISAVPWSHRRLVMFSSLGFCMASISYILIMDMQGAVAESAVTMGYFTIMSTVGSYVFGKVWETRAK